MKNLFRLITLSAVSIAAITNCQAASQPIAIPQEPDPPLTIDGNLDDWSMVPGKIVLDSNQHATYGQAWKGSNDLSATMQLSWRKETLYVAANVTDDIFRQTQRGANMWKGDHIELYLDTAPETDVGNLTFGAHQFQIGLSPGNFSVTGNALTDIKPEMCIFKPAGISAQGAQIAARRTANGYIIEASLPWSIFDFKPQLGLPLAMEIAVSDTDGIGAAQDKILTIGTAKWKLNRSRLLPAIFANADGSVPASVTSTSLFDNKNLQRNETKTITFDAPAIPEGYEGVLSLQARLQKPKSVGWAFALELTLNGKTIGPERLINKQKSEERVTGQSLATAKRSTFNVPNSPDFEAIDKSTSYALKNAKAALYEFRVGDLLKPSGNTLIIKDALPPAGVDKTLVVGNAKLLYRVPPVIKMLQGPPTGQLPTCAPQDIKPLKYEVTPGEDQRFALQIDGNHYNVTSQYSTPVGKWVNASNQFFTVKRQFEKKNEWIIVRDTFTNLTNENLPLMHREELQMKPDKVYVGGLIPSNITATTSEPHNPTVFGAQDKAGVGLLPLDDAFQVHITDFSTPNSIGLMDNNLVLKPKSTYTAEWAIVPVASTDYFDFLNSTRRLLDVNFKFDGPFAFFRADPNTTGKWSDQQVLDFARYKDAKYLCLDFAYPKYKGRYSQGTAFQLTDQTERLKAIARRRR